MLMEKERREIVDYGKKVAAANLTNGTSGNLSVYDPKLGYMAISPSGIPYEDTKPEDIVIMNLDDEIIEGDRIPSSEHRLHEAVYKSHPEARAIVHTHSKYCTVFSCLRREIQAVHYLIAGLGSSRIPCADYATYGSEDLAANVGAVQTSGQALLLANHGLVAFGGNLAKAFSNAEDAEWMAEIQWRAEAIGKPVILSDEQIDEVMTSFKGYGQKAATKEI